MLNDFGQGSKGDDGWGNPWRPGKGPGKGGDDYDLPEDEVPELELPEGFSWSLDEIWQQNQKFDKMRIVLGHLKAKEHPNANHMEKVDKKIE